MSGCAKTICSRCGIPTKREDGICGRCRAAMTAPRPCLMCSSETRHADRVCHSCSIYIREAKAHVVKDTEGLGTGRWVPAHGIRIWQEAS